MRGEQSPDDENAPVRGSVCVACCARQCRGAPTDNDGGRCGYSDEGGWEAGDDDRTRCKGVGDSHEAPPSRCLTLMGPCCCCEDLTGCYHQSSDDLAFCGQWPGMADARL